MAINLYSDYDRLNHCIPGLKKGDEGNSVQFDIPLILLSAYHLVEFVRVIMYLTTILLGVNLIPIYYLSYINTIFGIAAYMVCHAYRYSPAGIICAEG